MSDNVSYSRSGDVAMITMDDNKVNAMSVATMTTINAALDQAERNHCIVILRGRVGVFSGGFDLSVFKQSPSELHAMLKTGAELAERILGFPQPVIALVTGHAVAMGAFLVLAADIRIGAGGDFSHGFNEVRIGLTVPQFAIELARQRLTPAHFNRTVITGEMFSPEESVTAGLLDRLVSPDHLDSAGHGAALALGEIDRRAHAVTKRIARAPALAAIRNAIETELTLENAEKAMGQ